MAQLAAQDYFSRLQMSGMLHPDLANFSAMSSPNAMQSLAQSSPSSSNKNNLKRKEKTMQNYTDNNKPLNSSRKASSQKEV